MSFKSLDRILRALEQQSGWHEQPFQRLLKYWPEDVGAEVAAHTRPISIQRDVLSVATSSAAWAQTLTFGRKRILEKLNMRLPSPLVDIRFSTAHWQRSQSSSLASENRTSLLERSHPSYLMERPSLPEIDETANLSNPNTTFSRWAKVVQAKYSGLPLCPQCQCPTPEGELRRWGICSICATKGW